jgi:hypothetical protein
MTSAKTMRRRVKMGMREMRVNSTGVAMFLLTAMSPK